MFGSDRSDCVTVFCSFTESVKSVVSLCAFSSTMTQTSVTAEQESTEPTARLRQELEASADPVPVRNLVPTASRLDEVAGNGCCSALNFDPVNKTSEVIRGSFYQISAA